MSVNRTLCFVSKYSRQLYNSKIMIPLNINICTAATSSNADHHQFNNHHWNHLQQQFNRYQCYQSFLNYVNGRTETNHYYTGSSSTLPLPLPMIKAAVHGQHSSSTLLGNNNLQQQQVRQHSTMSDASNNILNKKRRNSEDHSRQAGGVGGVANDNQQLCVSGTDVISNKKNYTTALSNMTKDQANDLVFRLTDQERTLLLQVLTQFQSNQERKRLESKRVIVISYSSHLQHDRVLVM